ncbi:MAG: type I-C CRISPR-associated protein Cas7/Csd2 [Salinibacter sp.]|uniref:type I-C CRISPR-associated protein Cas7/Csd2 n=1 Tax=Salinibacter sp. TaxID=2065818 RepID=UPI0035D41E35
MPDPHLDPDKRHDFVYLFDVEDGNPNGDPDAGNLPRVDPETMQGLVTDVAVKRKIRDYIDASVGGDEDYKIYMQHQGVLNEQHQRAYDELNLDSDNPSREDVDEARAWMCQNFYDIRTFGAVMSTGVNAGQVRGPMQLTFARSVDPVVPMDVSITRVAITRSDDAESKETEMGRKAIVPYGLYRGHGFYNPKLAEDTGFGSDDLQLFWQALQMGWELDRSASRGFVALRGLYVFTHDNPLGNAPAHTLFDRVEADLTADVEAPRKFGHYDVTVEDDDLPTGVTLTRVLG